MKEEEETSNFSMKDYYKVLKYLYNSKVDRQEPISLDCPVMIGGDSIVIPTIHNDFNGIDTVQLFLNCNNRQIDISNLKLGFSPLLNGNAELLSVNCNDTEIDAFNDTMLTFDIDANFNATDQSRLLTGVQSLKFDFQTDVSGIVIQKVYMRSVDYTYTIDDLQVALENGEAYVLRRLNEMEQEKKGFKNIPKQLKQYIYMAAGAYAWLTRWEYEAKPMKEPKSESNNYADRLFAQVDDAITKYLSNIENNRNEEYLDLDQVATGRITWGIR